NLPNELLAFLTQYYNNAYNYRFISLANLQTASSSSILVLPNLTIYRRVMIRNEIFRSTFSKRHKKAAKILANFILDYRSTNIFPGLVQYYFEHVVQLLEGPKKISFGGIKLLKTLKQGFIVK
ncbi:6507_t:CDS:1, partial [Gigaspora rosea]